MYFKVNITQRETDCHSVETRYLVIADSQEEAAKRANKFVSDWYKDESLKPIGNNCWTFFDGDIVFTIADPVEIKQGQFEELNKDRYAIG